MHFSAIAGNGFRILEEVCGQALGHAALACQGCKDALPLRSDQSVSLRLLVPPHRMQGQEVEFDLVKTEKGPVAENVVVL